MSVPSIKGLLGAWAAFLIPLLTGAGVVLAQAPNFDPYAAPSRGRAANFTSSSLFAEGDATTTASDAPAIGPGGCDSCSCPTWTVTADAIFLTRTPAHSVTLARLDTSGVPNVPPFPEMLNSSDLKFNWAAGPRVSLMRHGEAFDWELAHFNVTGWSAHGNANSPGVFQFPEGLNVNSGTSFVLGSVNNSSQLDIYNTSSLFSTEANIRKELTPNITGLVGFRWVEFDDKLRAHALTFNNQITGFDLNFRNYNTYNRMYGLQAGLDVTLFNRGRFGLRSVLKAGLYGNSILSHFDLADLSSLNQQDHTATQVTFLGDLAINGTYRLSDHWTLRGGYQLLWLDGIALAPTQIPWTDANSAANTFVITGNSLFAHGATVGLEAAW